jgi:hypothetical protein
MARFRKILFSEDVQRRKTMTLATLNLPVRVAACVLLTATPAVARAELFFLRARLEPTDAEPLASGRAVTYQTYTHPFTGRLAVRVHDVFTVDTVAVLINDEFVTTIPLTDGRGEVRLSSSHGDDVPLILDGDILDVINHEDGTVLLGGIFELLGPH